MYRAVRPVRIAGRVIPPGEPVPVLDGHRYGHLLASGRIAEEPDPPPEPEPEPEPEPGEGVSEPTRAQLAADLVELGIDPESLPGTGKGGYVTKADLAAALEQALEAAQAAVVWFYSGNPATRDVDAVRWHVGDTDDADPLVQDEQIEYALAQEGSVLAAAAAVCDGLGARFARQADKAVGDLRISASQRSKAYADRAAEIRARVGRGAAAPYIGGISRSEKRSVEDQPDRVPNQFRIGMDDDHGVLTEDPAHGC